MYNADTDTAYVGRETDSSDSYFEPLTVRVVPDVEAFNSTHLLNFVLEDPSIGENIIHNARINGTNYVVSFVMPLSDDELKALDSTNTIYNFIKDAMGNKWSSGRGCELHTTLYPMNTLARGIIYSTKDTEGPLNMISPVNLIFSNTVNNFYNENADLSNTVISAFQAYYNPTYTNTNNVGGRHSIEVISEHFNVAYLGTIFRSPSYQWKDENNKQYLLST